MNRLRYALRSSFQRGHRLISAAAVVTLALGIGAATSVFSIVDTLLIREPDYPRPKELVYVGVTSKQERGRNLWGQATDLPTLEDWRRSASGMIDLLGFQTSSLPFGQVGLTRNIVTVGVTSNAMDVVGVRPIHGRVFLPSDDVRGTRPTVILSHGLWLRYFGGDPEAIGRHIMLGNQDAEIIGVMPRGFHLPLSITDDPQKSPEMWIPITVMQALLPGAPPLAQMPVEVVGRTRPGVNMARLERDLEAVLRQRERSQSDESANHTVQVSRISEVRAQLIRAPLILVSAAVGLLVLLMCLNVANLQLTRAISRDRETAVKVALGVSRWRLGSEFLIEGLLVGIIGSALGCITAMFVVPFLVDLAGSSLPDADSINVNVRVLIFASLLGLTSGTLIALWPAGAAIRRSPLEALAFRAAARSARTRRWMSRFVSLEVAFAVLVLIATSLVVRSFARISRLDRGHEIRGVAVGGLILPQTTYPNASARRAFIARLRDELERTRSLRFPVVASGVPMIGGTTGMIWGDDGGPTSAGLRTRIWSYTGDYFRALGITLVSGTQPSPGANSVAIDISAARALFGSANPLGRRVLIGRDKREAVVVAVVNDIMDLRMDLGSKSWLRQSAPHVYVPDPPDPPAVVRLAARLQGGQGPAIEDLRRAVAAVDRTLALDPLDTLDGLIATSLARERLTLYAVVLFGILSVVLAGTGVFAVVAHSTAQRTHEMGVRVALGAEPGSITFLVLRDAVRTSAFGSCVGVLGAIGAAKAVRSVLFETSPLDLVSFVSVVLLINAVVLAATVLPAVRASHADPAKLLAVQ